MEALQNKIDFTVIFSVKNANPNGDPLDGNRPRVDSDGHGEVSDVCIKRKIRNRLKDMGENIFVRSNDDRGDKFGCMKDRADKNERIVALGKNPSTNELYDIVCSEWIDVRSFGQIFAFKSFDPPIGVRGPVSIQHAVSVDPVEVETFKIAPSANNSKDYDTKGKDRNTLGDKHFVRFGLYVFHDSINCQLAEKTGFTDEDAEKIKQALMTLFENDCSSARPEGSMEVCRLYWWKHDSRTPKYSSAKIHRLLNVKLKDGIDRARAFEDYDIALGELEGAVPEIYDLV